MKVGIDIRDLQIAKTGARTYLLELINALQNHPDKNFEYILLDTSFRVYNSNNKLFKLIEHFRFFFWKQFILPIKAKIKGCDILICTDYFVPVIKLGIETIPVFHDAFFYEYPQHYNKYWLFLFKTLAIKAARKSKVIITPTLYAKEQLVKFSKIEPSKFIVIYEAGKTLSPPPINSNYSVDNKLKAHPYLLHIGTLEIRKNIPLLLKALKIVKSDFPNLKLVLAGQFSNKISLSDKPAILKTIKDLNLDEEVILTGFLADELLSTYYNNALIYVFPSLNEGFGLPILESFSHKLPVVASNNSCLPEIGGDVALYFNPFDEKDLAEKIITIATNESLRKELVTKGVERVKFFTWSNTADGFVKQFYKITND